MFHQPTPKPIEMNMVLARSKTFNPDCEICLACEIERLRTDRGFLSDELAHRDDELADRDAVIETLQRALNMMEVPL